MANVTTYQCPTKSPKYLVNTCNKTFTEFRLEIADFEKPDRTKWLTVFRFFIKHILGVSDTCIDTVPLNYTNIEFYEQLYVGTMNWLWFYKILRTALEVCKVDQFTVHDFLFLNSPTICRILSPLLNYYLFKSHQHNSITYILERQVELRGEKERTIQKLVERRDELETLKTEKHERLVRQREIKQKLEELIARKRVLTKEKNDEKNRLLNMKKEVEEIGSKNKSKSTMVNITKDSTRKLQSIKNFNVKNHEEEMRKLEHTIEEKKEEKTRFTEDKLQLRNQMQRIEYCSSLIDELSLEVDNYENQQKIEETLKDKLLKVEASLVEARRSLENDQRSFNESKQKLEISESNCIKLEREVEKVKSKARKMMSDNLSASSTEEDKIKKIKCESEKLKTENRETCEQLERIQNEMDLISSQYNRGYEKLKKASNDFKVEMKEKAKQAAYVPDFDVALQIAVNDDKESLKKLFQPI
ncbi:DgyrCDS12824 [Dimorphilus gyrociliatus]|uniref:DgyrCDS12824 n=1 Tax=Dimorphilus gyrociliatus TaxID=2664684 RepID=A0A7I8W8V7_9ANNE|nr:DgyrCDS12824 [Dimorphilus gyrociliatus]